MTIFNVIWGEKWLLGTERNEFLEARGSFFGGTFMSQHCPLVSKDFMSKMGKKCGWIQQKARKQVRLNQFSALKLSTSPA